MKKSYTIKRIYTNEKSFEKILVDVFLAEIRKEQERKAMEESGEVK